MTTDEVWASLVAYGRTLRRDRNTRPDGSPRRFHGRADATQSVPDAVRRWVVSRADGATLKQAARVSGTDWAEVNALYRTSEECRCAIDALTVTRRLLERERAYYELERTMVGKGKPRQTQWAVNVLKRYGL